MDIDPVINVAPYFGVDADVATSIASRMAATIKDERRNIGAQAGMTPTDFTAVAPAMENLQIERAIALAQRAIPGGATP